MDYSSIIDEIGIIYTELDEQLKTDVSVETGLPKTSPYVLGTAGALSKTLFNYAVILLYDKMVECRKSSPSFSDELEDLLNGLSDCRPVPRNVLDNLIEKRDSLRSNCEELFENGSAPQPVSDALEQIKASIDDFFDGKQINSVSNDSADTDSVLEYDDINEDENENEVPINFDELGTINHDGSVNYERLAHAIVSICNDLTMKGVGHTQMMDASAMASIATGTMLYIFATILAQGQIFKYTHNQIEYKLEEAKMMKSFASAFLVPVKALKKGVAKTSFNEAKETLEYADQGDSFPVKDSMKKIAAIIGLTWNR